MKNFFFLLAFFTLSINIHSQTTTIQDIAPKKTNTKFGILGQQAPELTIEKWVDSNGKKTEPYKLSNLKGKVKVIYCFQAWCPGCHSIGLPSLKKMTTSLDNSNKVAFLAIQTVFEGKNSNTLQRMLEIQKKYNLKIPFGHDDGKNTPRKISSTMQNYRTGGTPWFIIIDESNKVIFNDYHLNTDKVIEYLKDL